MYIAMQCFAVSSFSMSISWAADFLKLYGVLKDIALSALTYHFVRTKLPESVNGKMVVDQREVALKRKEELQMKHRQSDLFFAPFDPRFPNQNQTR